MLDQTEELELETDELAALETYYLAADAKVNLLQAQIAGFESEAAASTLAYFESVSDKERAQAVQNRALLEARRAMLPELIQLAWQELVAAHCELATARVLHADVTANVLQAKIDEIRGQVATLYKEREHAERREKERVGAIWSEMRETAAPGTALEVELARVLMDRDRELLTVQGKYGVKVVTEYGATNPAVFKSAAEKIGRAMRQKACSQLGMWAPANII